MRILVLTSTFPRSKSDTEPRFVDSLCQYLSPDNTIDVVAPHDKDIPTRELLDNNVEIFRFRYCPQKWETLAYNGGILPSLKENRLKILLIPFFLLGQLLLVTKLLRRNDYDIIHAHWIIPQGLVAALACLFFRKPPPIVLTSHGGDLFALKGPLLSRLKTWITGRAKHLTVVSSAMKAKAEALGQSAAHLSVIPMGVDAHGTFLPPPEDASREGLIFVGRLVDKKGIEYLIRAMPQVLAKYPGQRLTIIGDGPLKHSLLELCESSGVADAIRFEGSLTNQAIPPYLQRAAIAIIPSVVTDSGDQEGAPVAIMETLACGCATIVSDYPGARDIIVDNENGLLVTPKSPADIAEKINYLLEKPLVCSSLGKEGRERVLKEFDWQVIAKDFMTVFNAVDTGQQPTIESSPVD